MRLYRPRKEADVVVELAADERDDFTAEEDGDPVVGLEADRAADVGCLPSCWPEIEQLMWVLT